MASWDWPNSTISRVVDGDTVTAYVERALGFEGTVTFPVQLRLNRINTAKGTTKRGKAATARVTELVTGVKVNITTVKHYKYGGPDNAVAEYMAEVVLPDGKNVSDVLVAEKLADYWDGTGARPDDS